MPRVIPILHNGGQGRAIRLSGWTAEYYKRDNESGELGKRLWFSARVLKAWVATDRKHWSHKDSGGNAVLLKLGKTRYAMAVWSGLWEFHLGANEQVVDFVSNVGNNSVHWPYVRVVDHQKKRQRSINNGESLISLGGSRSGPTRCPMMPTSIEDWLLHCTNNEKPKRSLHIKKLANGE